LILGVFYAPKRVFKNIHLEGIIRKNSISTPILTPQKGVPKTTRFLRGGERYLQKGSKTVPPNRGTARTLRRQKGEPFWIFYISILELLSKVLF